MPAPPGKRLACARCKRLKVKCSLRDSSSSKCERCISSKSECRLASPASRQNSARHDDRVTTLETTVANLQNLINQQANFLRQPFEGIDALSSGIDDCVFENDPSFDTSGRGYLDQTVVEASWYKAQDRADFPELGASGLLSEAKMSSMFESIRLSLSTALVIPLSATYTDMSRERPIVLQVLLAIAASNESDLYLMMYKRMKDRLIHEYFVKQTRTMDLIQGLLLSCEYTFPIDYKTSWTLHSFPTLATEVAMDLGLFKPLESGRDLQDGMNDLERRRIVIWLYTVHAGLLLYSRRQPQRLLWTEYHAACYRQLQVSECRSDQNLVSAVAILQLTMEILACGGPLRFMDVLQSFDRRITIMDQSFPAPQAPKIILGIAGLRLVLHENYIRTITKENALSTSVVQSMEICKTAALEILGVIENLTIPEGSTCGHPGYYFAKPLGALITLCKIYHWSERLDDNWTYAYAQRVDAVMAHHANRGLGLARSMCGKAMALLQWLKSSPVLNADTTVFEGMSSLCDRPSEQCSNVASEVDVQSIMQ